MARCKARARKAGATNYYPNTVPLLGSADALLFFIFFFFLSFPAALAFRIDKSSFRNEEIGPGTADAR